MQYADLCAARRQKYRQGCDREYDFSDIYRLHTDVGKALSQEHVAKEREREDSREQCD
jgi:hypothetical protein